MQVRSRHDGPVHRLEVRPLRPDEVPHVVDYSLDAAPEDIVRMGVDPNRLLPRDEWIHRLQDAVVIPPEKATGPYTAWLVDGEAIRLSSLKNLRYGGTGEMHLHMWSRVHRGKGFGGVLFCLAALDGYERFRLQHIVCEPKASNPMPNRMLAKVGFPLVRSYEGKSSELSAVTTLNRYDIDRGIAQAYVEGMSV